MSKEKDGLPSNKSLQVFLNTLLVMHDSLVDIKLVYPEKYNYIRDKVFVYGLLTNKS